MAERELIDDILDEYLQGDPQNLGAVTLRGLIGDPNGTVLAWSSLRASLREVVRLSRLLGEAKREVAEEIRKQLPPHIALSPSWSRHPAAAAADFTHVLAERAER